MNSVFRLVLFIAIFFDFAAAAAKVELYSWQSRPTLPPTIIPVSEGKTPEQAAREYIESLRLHPDLSKLFKPTDLSDLRFSDFKKLSRESKSRTLLIANRASDYVSQAGRIGKFRARYEAQDSDVFLLPISAELNLESTEISDYHQAIVDHFTILAPMGGHDVNPDEYHHENVASNNVNATRDRSEIALIRAFEAAARGFIFGVCRGAQITAVALGYQLKQHIDDHLQKTDPHEALALHDITLIDTESGILAEIASGIRTFFVNSYHHQAVLLPSSPRVELGPLAPAAFASDGTLEAMEMKNRRGLLLQWHPEFMNDPFTESIFKTVVQIAKHDRIDACHARFGGGGR